MDASASMCRTAFTSMEELNALPTFWSILPFALAAGAASVFLEVFVLSAAAHFLVFCVGSYVVFSSYFTADYFLARISTSYARISDDKKFYVR